MLYFPPSASTLDLLAGFCCYHYEFLVHVGSIPFRHFSEHVIGSLQNARLQDDININVGIFCKMLPNVLQSVLALDVSSHCVSICKTFMFEFLFMARCHVAINSSLVIQKWLLFATPFRKSKVAWSLRRGQRLCRDPGPHQTIRQKVATLIKQSAFFHNVEMSFFRCFGGLNGQSVGSISFPLVHII